MGTPRLLAVLDRERLRDVTMSDGELMRNLVSTLIDDTSRQMLHLAEAVRGKDAGRCARLAHYSKGACSNVGAEAVAAALRRVEQDACKGDFGGCAASLVELEAEFERLRCAAEDLIGAGRGS